MRKTISKAVHELIGRRRDEAIDVALAKGYGIAPQGDEENSGLTKAWKGWKRRTSTGNPPRVQLTHSYEPANCFT